MTVSVAAGAALLMAVPATASAHSANGGREGTPLGTRSLAAYLTANGNGTFDNNPFDFDIATQAVLAVVKAKPNSPVALLTKGDVALTAFLPEDFAFRNLVRQLGATKYGSEQEVFDSLVAAVPLDTIESILLYHVVPGKTITSKDAVNSDGAVLTTAYNGPTPGTIKVDVVFKAFGIIKLIDADTNDANPYLNPFLLDRNKGNLQIAHGITAVLRPIDLP